MDYQIYDLLEKKNKVICDMIDMIYFEKNPLSIHILSGKLHLNERSVQRYIHDLENIISDFNDERDTIVSFSYSKFKGISIEFFEYSPYNLKKFIADKDINIKTFIDLIYGNFSNIQLYSREHYLSENLIRKVIKKINIFTEEFAVITKAKFPFFYGDEKNIRLCFNIFFWSMYRDSKWPFFFIDQDKVYDSIDNFSKEANVYFSTIHKRQFAYLLAINNLRYHQKRYIKKSRDWYDYVNIEKLKETSIIKSGINKYNIYDENEIYFYLILIQMKTKMYESDELRKRIFSYHEKKQSDIYYLTKFCITEFQKNFFRLSEEQEEFVFIYLFCTNLYCSVFKHVKVDIDGYILKENSIKHKRLLQKIDNFLKENYEKTHNTIFLEKEFLNFKYYMLISALDNPVKYEKKVNILLSSDLPILMRKQVKQEILNNFGNIYNLQIHENHKDHQNVDFVLTNFPSLYQKKETINIDYPLSDYNLIVIEKNILRYLDE